MVMPVRADWNGSTNPTSLGFGVGSQKGELAGSQVSVLEGESLARNR